MRNTIFKQRFIFPADYQLIISNLYLDLTQNIAIAITQAIESGFNRYKLVLSGIKLMTGIKRRMTICQLVNVSICINQRQSLAVDLVVQFVKIRSLTIVPLVEGIYYRLLQ